MNGAFLFLLLGALVLFPFACLCIKSFFSGKVTGAGPFAGLIDVDRGQKPKQFWTLWFLLLFAALIPFATNLFFLTKFLFPESQ